MSPISNNDIAQAIYLSSLEHKADKDFLEKVVKFLARKRLLSKSGEILKSLNKVIDMSEGRVVAKVDSVLKLGEKTKRELEIFLKKRYGAREVAFAENIDEKLIGGLKVEVGDEVMDFTLKNRMGKLQAYLTR